MQKFSKINHFLKLGLFFIGNAIIISIDQWLKYMVRQDSLPHICNSGISFNLKIPFLMPLLFLTTFILLLFIFIFIHKIKDFDLFLFGSVLITGGVLSNILDRLISGCVIDYIFPFFGTMPIFNLADAGIFIGGCVMLYYFLYKNPYFNE